MSPEQPRWNIVVVTAAGRPAVPGCGTGARDSRGKRESGEAASCRGRGHSGTQIISAGGRVGPAGECRELVGPAGECRELVGPAGECRGLLAWIRRRARRPGPGRAGRAWRVSGRHGSSRCPQTGTGWPRSRCWTCPRRCGRRRLARGWSGPAVSRPLQPGRLQPGRLHPGRRRSWAAANWRPFPGPG
jgi:hypothetical protein